MISFLWYVMRRAFQNIKGNLFPNLTTIGIIAISILIFSAFTLISSTSPPSSRFGKIRLR